MIKIYILTDGINFVMENPLKSGEYISTTSSAMANEFTYKKAKSLLQNKKKSMSWIKGYYMIDCNSNEKEDVNIQYQGKADVFVGKNDIIFNEEIIKDIKREVTAIINISAWDISQIKEYKDKLNNQLSKYDSANSDILHALLKYREDNDGKKPPAHKMAKIAYMVDDIYNKRKNIKECLRYVQIMEDAIHNKSTLNAMKKNFLTVRTAEYKGRTDYYKEALDVLNK